LISIYHGSCGTNRQPLSAGERLSEGPRRQISALPVASFKAQLLSLPSSRGHSFSLVYHYCTLGDSAKSSDNSNNTIFYPDALALRANARHQLKPHTRASSPHKVIACLWIFKSSYFSCRYLDFYLYFSRGSCYLLISQRRYMVTSMMLSLDINSTILQRYVCIHLQQDMTEEKMLTQWLWSEEYSNDIL